MARDTAVVEDRRDRADLAADAGFGRISLFGVLAGVVVAFGTFAVLAALTAAIVGALGIDTDFSTNEWRQAGFAAAAILAVVQFLSYFFGGYVAGRMARRSGGMNGVLVFFLALIVAAGVAGLANAFADTSEVTENLRSIGVPTTGDEWRDVGAVAAGASLLAMLLGSILGGVKGERWHGKLIARAWDPEVGAGMPVNPSARHTAVVGNDRDIDGRDGGDTRIVDDGQSVMTSRKDTTLDEDYGRRDGRDGRDRDGDGVDDRNESTLSKTFRSRNH